MPPAAIAPLVVVGASETTRAPARAPRSRRSAGWRGSARSRTLRRAPKASAQIVVGEATVCLPLGSLIDLEAEAARLQKEIAKVTEEIAPLHKKLSNESSSPTRRKKSSRPSAKSSPNTRRRRSACRPPWRGCATTADLSGIGRFLRNFRGQAVPIRCGAAGLHRWQGAIGCSIFRRNVAVKRQPRPVAEIPNKFN